MIRNVDVRDDFIGVFETDIHCMQFIEYHKKAEQDQTLCNYRVYPGKRMRLKKK